MRSDQSTLSVRVGHFHVQLTGVYMYNFTLDEKKNAPFLMVQHRFGGCGMRDAGSGAKSRRNVGSENYRGWDTG